MPTIQRMQKKKTIKTNSNIEHYIALAWWNLGFDYALKWNKQSANKKENICQYCNIEYFMQSMRLWLFFVLYRLRLFIGVCSVTDDVIILALGILCQQAIKLCILFCFACDLYVVVVVAWQTWHFACLSMFTLATVWICLLPAFLQ